MSLLNTVYDILGLTELHNMQAKELSKGRKWVYSAASELELDEKGHSTNPVERVVIVLSPRTTNKIRGGKNRLG